MKNICFRVFRSQIIYLVSCSPSHIESFDISFSDLSIKGRSAGGNLVTKQPIKRIDLKENGVSTLSARKIWFDETVQRINVDDRGELLGEFKADDDLIIFQQSGAFKIVKPDLNMHFPEDMIILEKLDRVKPVTIIYNLSLIHI